MYIYITYTGCRLSTNIQPGISTLTLYIPKYCNIDTILHHLRASWLTNTCLNP